MVGIFENLRCKGGLNFSWKHLPCTGEYILSSKIKSKVSIVDIVKEVLCYREKMKCKQKGQVWQKKESDSPLPSYLSHIIPYNLNNHFVIIEAGG